MRLARLFLLVVIFGAVGCLVSCKEETPADRIDDTTQALEKKAEELQKQVEEKALEKK